MDNSNNNIAKLFEDITDEAIMGILTFHIHSRSAIYHNRLAKNLFEINETLPGISDITLDELFPKDSRGDFTPFSDKITTHQGLYQDILMRRTNGQTFVANVGVRHIYTEGGEILLLMVQDITLQKKLQRDITAKQIEIKAAYEELLRQNRQLKELDHAKNKFLALTTHELRTPLSAMVSSAEILKLELYDSPAQAKEFIDIIYDQGLQLQRLVNDILDMAKIQANKMDYYVQEEDINPILQSLAENYSSMATTSDVTIQFKPQTEEQKAYFDNLRIRQIVSNIINNAIKYNRKNGSVEISTETTDDHFLRIAVKDSGPGIPADKFGAIFDEFETIGQVSAHHNGTGLGLPISRKMMEAMGGKVHLTSEVGVGTTFYIDIPTTRVLPEEMYRPRPEQNADLAA